MLSLGRRTTNAYNYMQSKISVICNSCSKKNQRFLKTISQRVNVKVKVKVNVKVKVKVNVKVKVHVKVHGTASSVSSITHSSTFRVSLLTLAPIFTIFLPSVAKGRT